MPECLGTAYEEYKSCYRVITAFNIQESLKAWLHFVQVAGRDYRILPNPGAFLQVLFPNIKNCLRAPISESGCTVTAICRIGQAVV